MHRSTAVALGARIEMFLANQALQRAVRHPGKSYPACPRLPLPPARPISMALGDALERRCSVRAYHTREATSRQTLADLLGWGCGLIRRGRDGETAGQRSYPSGGALYPLEVYVGVRRVQDVPPGLYHYHLRDHALELIGGEDAAGQVLTNLTQEDAAGAAHFCVLVTAVFMRTCFKYGERGYRFVLLEAGHLMQNLCLLAPALHLGLCALGGYYDDALHEVLGVNGVDEAVVYAATAGRAEG